MKRVMAVGILGLAVALSLALGRAPAAGGAEGAGAPMVKLAIVDLEKVLQRSAEWTDCQGALNEVRDRMRRSLADYEKQIKVLRSECENLPPETEDVRRKLLEIDAVRLQYQQAKSEFERQIEAKRAEALRSVLSKVGDIVEKYAKEHDIDLVLKKRPVNLLTAQPQELNVFMAADVLYAKERFDITDTVLAELNARYPREIRDK